MKQCQFCVSELPDDAMFCGICGRVQSSSQAAARGTSGNAVLNQSNPGNANGGNAFDYAERRTRRPYQYSGQAEQAEEPTAWNPERPYEIPQVTPAGARQASPPHVNPTPAPTGWVTPAGARQASPPHVNPTPAPTRAGRRGRPRKRRGCLVGCLVVLLLLCVVGGFTVVTLQRVMAFGSAISTQAPLSTQTGYMGTSDRVNILVLGYGGSGHDGAYLTDSMMVMSMIPSSHHTTLVSVPRDLWVQVPSGSGNYQKINAVYEVGSNNHANPVAGGDATAEKVKVVTGLDVKYWVTIDFKGFRNFINAIGGIDVFVPDSFIAMYPKNDDPSIDAGWKNIHFSKGMQHMDGERAIEYARARYVLDNAAEGTDFARSARQQIIVKAALSKMKQISTWPSLYNALDALSHAIYTNLSLADLVQFALKMDLDKAHHVGLSNQNVLTDASIGGQSVLLPRNNDWQAIKDYVNQQLYA